MGHHSTVFDAEACVCLTWAVSKLPGTSNLMLHSANQTLLIFGKQKAVFPFKIWEAVFVGRTGTKACSSGVWRLGFTLGRFVGFVFGKGSL